MHTDLHTPICDLLGCDVPVLIAGMGGVARSELVSAVTRAGGFGFLGMVRESPELIRDEIAKVRAATGRDFGVSLIPAATPHELFAAEVDVCIAERVPVVALFWDLSRSAVHRLREAGILVVCQVGSTEEAIQAENAGAHIIVAQGGEAGGHVRGTSPLSRLIPEVSKAVTCPVVAAGGMADGRAAANAMVLGAHGVMMGTAFLATTESFAHDYHKRKIVEAKANTTIRTDAFHVNWPLGAFVRVLPNSVTAGKHGDPFSGERGAIGRDGGRTIWLFSTDSPLRSMTGDFEAMALYAGEGVGEISAIVPATDRLAAIVRDMRRALPAASAEATTEPAPEEAAPAPASPVCYANEGCDLYAGYASRDELLALLNELLEAERAGARIAARTATDTSDPELSALMKQVRADEAHWCAMLLKWIAKLDGEPSARTGAFYEKCLAIKDLRERAAFINRGQGWVVRKLREILPRVRNDEMHKDFSLMLKAHEDNIALTNTLLDEKSR